MSPSAISAQPADTQTRADLRRAAIEADQSDTAVLGGAQSGLLESTTTVRDPNVNPVDYAKQQVAEANTAADAATDAYNEALLAYVPGFAYYGSSLEEVLEDLTPDERAGEYIHGKDARAGFTIDFDPEEGEGQPAHYSTTGSRADFWRQHYNAEIKRVNDTIPPLEEITSEIRALQESGRQVYTDSEEWRRYLSARQTFDDAVELAHRRLQMGRNSNETRLDALQRHVSGVNEKLAAAGAPEAYQTYPEGARRGRDGAGRGPGLHAACRFPFGCQRDGAARRRRGVHHVRGAGLRPGKPADQRDV